ncbi:MAG: AMP-binding protein [Sphingobium sp.]
MPEQLTATCAVPTPLPVLSLGATAVRAYLNLYQTTYYIILAQAGILHVPLSYSIRVNDDRTVTRMGASSTRAQLPGSGAGVRLGRLRMQLIEHFQQSAKRWPERIAFVQPDGALIDYASALRTVDAIARALRSSGLPADAKIAIFSPNDAAGFLTMLGTVRAGFAWASLNARNTIDDNIAFARLAEASVLFFHSQFEVQVREILAQVPQISLVVCLDRSSSLGSALADFEMATTPAVPDLPDDNDRHCTIFATGGTTGRSRGAVWTNRTWETLFANFWTSAPDCEHPVHLCVAPMTHGAGVLALMLLPKGPTNVILTKADPVEILRAIETHKVTHLFLPPTVLYALLSSPQLDEFDTSSLRFFLISAAPVSPDRLKEAVQKFGSVMCQAFGQAEAPFFLTYLSPQDHLRAVTDPDQAGLLRSCGRATMFSHVEIMDEAGALLPRGKTGEIVARSNLVMAGYFKDPEATAEVSGFGWHHTGDIGWMDVDGYVYIVDRKRDMIITGGFNVFTTEVEAALMSHPAILNCAVIGVPDEKWGEAVKAVVELKPGETAGPEDLIAHCKAALGSVKAPKTIDIWDKLPRSPVGKVLKRSIRDRFWSGQQRAV